MYYPFFLSGLYIDSGWEQIPVLKATEQKYCVHVLYYWCSNLPCCSSGIYLFIYLFISIL